MSKVSCIITTHNRKNLLPGAIESVQEQTYNDIEIIIVNDSSTDGTSEVITEYAEQDSRILSIEANKGKPTLARNLGIEVASGEYIAFIDDDDRWHRKKIETQLPYADEYSAVSCIAQFIQEDGKSIQTYNFTGIKQKNFDNTFRTIRYLYPVGTLARAENIYSIGGFDEHLLEWDFYLRLVKEHGPAAVLDQPLTEINRKDIPRYSKKEEHFDNLFEIYNEYKHLASRSAQKERLSNLHYSYFMNGNRSLRRGSSAIKSIYYNPKHSKSIGKLLASRTLSKFGMKKYVKGLLG